jgi:hypothetical protein
LSASLETSWFGRVGDGRKRRDEGDYYTLCVVGDICESLHSLSIIFWLHPRLEHKSGDIPERLTAFGQISGLLFEAHDPHLFGEVQVGAHNREPAEVIAQEYSQLRLKSRLR